MLAPPQELGDTPQGRRRIIGITGGVAVLDTRYTMQTVDGALIYVRNAGYRHGPAHVDPSLHTMRTTPRFETGDARYAWLNRIACVASGVRRPASVELEVFEAA